MKAGCFFLFFCGLLIFFSSCSRAPQEDGSWVSSKISERIDKEVTWYRGGKEEFLIQERIQSLLAKELYADEAVQIALLNNPSIQATFEEIGIAQADLIEAGLFQNPFFESYIRFPSSKSSVVNASFSLATSFFDLLLIPLRKKTAALHFEKAKLQVANAIMNLTADVEQTFYALQAALLKAELQQTLLEAATAAGELAQMQKEAGNTSYLFFESKLADMQQSKLELKQTEIEVISLKEKMSILMGIPNRNWKIYSCLPELPDQERPLEELESIALRDRFDLAAAKKQVDAIASIGAQKKWWSYMSYREGEVGVSTEKEPEGLWETGPIFRFFIPLFNYGQADRARLLAQLRQSQARLRSLEIEVRAQVERAQDKLLKSREIVKYYAECVLPLRKKMIDSAEKQYNVMTYGIYDLLRNKREEVQSQINYEIALRDYWIARSALDLILGGKCKE